MSVGALTEDIEIVRCLRRLQDQAPGVRGVLVASVDGHPVAGSLPDHDDASASAVVAASLGLGRRLSELAGEGAMQEVVVRTASGYVVIYAVGGCGVLTVVTGRDANLALLNITARGVVSDLSALVSERGSLR